jgi:hypothetical protein
MSDYNNDTDINDIENDFPDPLPADSHEQIVLLYLIRNLRLIAHDIHDKLEVQRLFREVWDEGDWAEVGVKYWMTTAIDATVDRLWERYAAGSGKKL